MDSWDCGALGWHCAVPGAFGGAITIAYVGLSDQEDRVLWASGSGCLRWSCGHSQVVDWRHLLVVEGLRRFSGRHAAWWI